MPILDKTNFEEVEKYNTFLKENSNYNILQSIEWSELKNSWKNEIVYIEKEGKITASISLLLRKIPVINSYLAYGCRGPLVDINDFDTLKLLLEEINMLKDKYKIFLLRIDPRWNKSKLNIPEYKKIFNIRSNNVSTKLIIQPRLNMIINLEERSEEEIFRSFSETTRRNIRIAIKNGCVVKMDNSKEALNDFYDLHIITGKRDNFIIRSREYFEKLYDLFIDKGLSIWQVYHGEDMIGSTVMLPSGDTMWYYAGASSNIKRKMRANALLQYEMIKWAKNNGFKYYDLGGIYSTNPKIEPLYIFKNGFCKKDGVTEFIGELDYVYSKFKYKVYLFIERANLVKKKIYKLIKKDN